MPTNSQPQPAGSAAGPTARDKILIIDNDPELVDALSHRLHHHGFAVSNAATAAEGRTAAHADHPDLIVLDIRLPDTDGFTLCQELAGAEDTCGTPMILLSTMTRPDIIRRSTAAGCQYFVRKPFDPATLLTLIRRSIDESRGERGPGPQAAAATENLGVGNPLRGLESDYSGLL